MVMVMIIVMVALMFSFITRESGGNVERRFSAPSGTTTVCDLCHEKWKIRHISRFSTPISWFSGFKGDTFVTKFCHYQQYRLRA